MPLTTRSRQLEFGISKCRPLPKTCGKPYIKRPGRGEARMDPLNTGTLLLAAACIMAGALAKGFVGLGMPLVALPLLTYLMPVRDAVCVMALPMLLTNLYQMFESGAPYRALRRFWPFLLALVGGISLGAHFLTSLNGALLRLALGIVVILFAVGILFDAP